jgi:protein-disulfide isomerase
MTTTPFSIETGRLVVPVNEDDHVLGSPSASVTLVEYGDYQCPYCGLAYPIVKELLALRPDTVRLVFRHFPLTDLHPYAELAAELAEAAGVQGQFWVAHDWLYSHQDVLDPPTLSAAAMNLDPTGDLAKEFAARAYHERIHRDFIGGVRSGVNGTPTFFINGRRHDGGYSVAELLLAIDQA